MDHNATTPVDGRVAEAMLPFIREHFGNPSSSHQYGQTAKNAVDRARGEVAAFLGADPDEIVFTSGGSEANNMALKGIAYSNEAGDSGKKCTKLLTKRIFQAKLL